MEEQYIREIADESLQGYEELFLVDVKVKGTEGNQKVLIFIDGDKGISIDLCSKISKKIAELMEEKDFMKGTYMLEVSSPGLDFPLTLPRQYIKNVGRGLTIETIEGEKIVGNLLAANDKILKLEVAGKESKSLALEKIKQSKINISFK